MVKDNDPDQGPLTFRVFGICLVQLAISDQCSRVIKLLLLEVGHLGQVSGRQPATIQAAVRLIENLQRFRDPAHGQQDHEYLPETVQGLPGLPAQLLAPRQFESRGQVTRGTNQVFCPDSHRRVELPVPEITFGACTEGFIPAGNQFTHQ